MARPALIQVNDGGENLRQYSHRMAKSENRLVASLGNFSLLSEADVRELSQLETKKRRFAARTEIVREGDAFGPPFVVIEGTLCSFRMTRGGQRQIFNFFVPGDLYGFHEGFLERMDHSIASIGPATLEMLPRRILYQLARQSLSIDAALRAISLQDKALLRKHLVLLQRNAASRVATLLCELISRYAASGIYTGPGFHFPVAQTDIAESVGVTPVHVNRVLHDFKRDWLIALEAGRITVLNQAGLNEIAGLDFIPPLEMSLSTGLPSPKI
jgi:CRP-like cAMP-binding protein